MATQTDELTAAILIATGSISDGAQTIAAATSYCDQIKFSEDGWRLCLERLPQPTLFPQVRFWYLQVFQHLIAKRWSSLPEPDRATVRSSLMLFVRDVYSKEAQAHYVKTALASLLLRIAKHDYPELWPSFFSDFLAIVPTSPWVLDLFLQVLNIFDEEVVEYDEKRGSDEIAHNTKMKDTMRESVVQDLVDLWYNILVQCAESQPQLANAALDTMGRFIGWIDINLVANDRFVPLFFQCLSNPTLQKEACDCIFELVHKRMDAPKKLALIQQLRILDVVAGLDLAAMDEEFAETVAALVTNVGTQLIQCQAAFQTLADPEKTLALTECNALIEKSLQSAYLYMNYETYTVANEVVPFFRAYLDMLKKQGVCGDAEKVHLTRIVALVAKQMRFPEGYNFAQREEEETKFDEFRNALDTLFKNVGQSASQLTVDLVRMRFAQTVSNLNTLSFAEVEASLHLVYLFAEAIKDYNEMLNDGPLAEMLHMLIVGEISNYPHPQVTLQYFELIVRYPRFLEQHSELLGPVLTSFVDARGLQNPHSFIRNRICYHLFRLLKNMSQPIKQKLAPFAEELLRGLQGIITSVLQKESGKDSPITFTNCLFLAEVVGCLVSPQIVAEKSHDFLQSVLQVYQQRIDGLVGQRDIWIQVNPELAAKHIADSIEVVGNVFQAYSGEASRVADVVFSCLESVLRGFMALPTHSEIRSKTIFFLHRMVICLNVQVLPALPPAVTELINTSQSDNILPLLELVNQIVAKCKGALAFLESLFLPLAAKFFEIMQEFAYLRNVDLVQQPAAAFSAEQKHQYSLLKFYFTFINSILTCGSISIFSNPNVLPHVASIMAPVVQGCVDPPELQVHKVCFGILLTLARHWATNPQAISHLQSFFFNEVTPVMFQSPLSRHFVIQDVAALASLHSIVELQCLLAQVWGQQYLANVANFLVNNLHASHDIANTYCMLMEASNVEGLKSFFKELLSQKKT